MSAPLASFSPRRLPTYHGRRAEWADRDLNSGQPGNPRLRHSPHGRGGRHRLSAYLWRFPRLIHGRCILFASRRSVTRPITTTELCPVFSQTELSAQYAAPGGSLHQVGLAPVGYCPSLSALVDVRHFTIGTQRPVFPGAWLLRHHAVRPRTGDGSFTLAAILRYTPLSLIIIGLESNRRAVRKAPPPPRAPADD